MPREEKAEGSQSNYIHDFISGEKIKATPEEVNAT